VALLEPDVTLTDFAVTFECICLAIWLYLLGSYKSPFRVWFLLFFTMTGAASALGGVSHGFFPDTETPTYNAIWNATLLTVGMAALSCWPIGGQLLFSDRGAKWFFVLASALYIVYSMVVLFVNRTFFVAILHYAPAAGFLLISFFIGFIRWQRTYFLTGGIGVLLTFAAAAIQQSDLQLPAAGLTHNALYHVAQAIALLLVFVAARGVIRDRAIQAAALHLPRMQSASHAVYAAAFVAITAVLAFYVGYSHGRQIIRFAAAYLAPKEYDIELSRFVRQDKSSSKVIVFVHGVTGTPTKTWTFESNGASVYWPKLVEQDQRLSGYDIFVMSYYTPQLKEGPGIFQLADGLHKELVEHKIFPDKSGSAQYREVIFVCHSMANLILRNMMITNPLPNGSLTSVPLILSIASPSAGSALAELVEKIADSPVYQEMVKVERNSYLQLLNGVWKQASFDTEIACAFERKEYGRLGKRVVEEVSATAVCTRGNHFGVDEDHISIVKPPNADHDIHKWLVKEILQPIGKRAWELDRWVNDEIIVAGKDFLESNIQAAIIAAVLRAHMPGKKITTKYNMGNASRVFSALLERRIDVYPEYDGSLLYEYLRRPLPGEAGAPTTGTTGKIEDFVNIEMSKELLTLNLKYLPHFGFNDPYVLVMLRSKAQEFGILESSGKVSMTKLALLAPQLVLYSDQEFFSRTEWSALRERYELNLLRTDIAAHERIYQLLRESASARGAAIVVGFGSDAELNEDDTDIVTIEDDRKVLPNYYPAPLADKRLLRKFPSLEQALEQLAGLMTIKDMSELLATYRARLKEGPPQEAWRRLALETLVGEYLDKKRVRNTRAEP